MEKFWPHLLPSHLINESFANQSIDVALKGCFLENFDTTACIRNVLLCFFGFASLSLCIVRLIKLHYLRHPQIHQYLVFYFASLEVLFLTLKWILLTNVFQLEFAAAYLKLLQFILLCHFHWLLVSRIIHQERLINWIIIPILCIIFACLTAVSALGMASHLSTWVECFAPHWLLLSIIEAAGILLFAVAGVYITRKINSVSALESFKWEQKRDLWSVIAVYAFSSVTSLVYYSFLQAYGSFEMGCSGLFNNVQEYYSPVYAVFMVIKYLLPIWVMISVFQPTRGVVSSDEERLLGWSCSGSTTSVFCPGVRNQDTYKQMSLPVENSNEEGPTLKRSASMPALLGKPPLTPISEEDLILAASRVQYENYGATDSEVTPGPFLRSSGRRVMVSLNQCSDEMQSVTPSSTERA